MITVRVGVEVRAKGMVYSGLTFFQSKVRAYGFTALRFYGFMFLWFYGVMFLWF